jgi:endonuclease/exonuclease/phosphatase (EEP) superfamily protein YafD
MTLQRAAAIIHKLTVLTVLIVLSLSLLCLAGKYLYLELVTHFRLQYLIAALACGIVLIAFRSWKILPLAVCGTILNLLPILPYYYAPPETPASTQLTNFKLLLANALRENRSYTGLLTEVQRTNPDVLVIQEFTEQWKTETAVLSQQYPFTLLEPSPSRSGSGMAIFSRYPLAKKERLVLDSSSHFALRVDVVIDQKRFAILAMHPTTPVTPWKFRNRNKQLAEAASIIRAETGPKILVGDLNVTMWSPYFEKLLRESGLRDTRRGFGLQTTWPVPLPSFLRLPIDHCLVSEEWLVQGVRTIKNPGSDHKAVLFELALMGIR